MPKITETVDALSGRTIFAKPLMIMRPGGASTPSAKSITEVLDAATGRALDAEPIVFVGDLQPVMVGPDSVLSTPDGRILNYYSSRESIINSPLRAAGGSWLRAQRFHENGPLVDMVYRVAPATGSETYSVASGEIHLGEGLKGVLVIDGDVTLEHFGGWSAYNPEAHEIPANADSVADNDAYRAAMQWATSRGRVVNVKGRHWIKNSAVTDPIRWVNGSRTVFADGACFAFSGHLLPILWNDGDDFSFDLGSGGRVYYIGTYLNPSSAPYQAGQGFLSQLWLEHIGRGTNSVQTRARVSGGNHGATYFLQGGNTYMNGRLIESPYAMVGRNIGSSYRMPLTVVSYLDASNGAMGSHEFGDIVMDGYNMGIAGCTARRVWIKSLTGLRYGTFAAEYMDGQPGGWVPPPHMLYSAAGDHRSNPDEFTDYVYVGRWYDGGIDCSEAHASSSIKVVYQKRYDIGLEGGGISLRPVGFMELGRGKGCKVKDCKHLAFNYANSIPAGACALAFLDYTEALGLQMPDSMIDGIEIDGMEIHAVDQIGYNLIGTFVASSEEKVRGIRFSGLVITAPSIAPGGPLMGLTGKNHLVDGELRIAQSNSGNIGLYSAGVGGGHEVNLRVSGLNFQNVRIISSNKDVTSNRAKITDIATGAVRRLQKHVEQITGLIKKESLVPAAGATSVSTSANFVPAGAVNVQVSARVHGSNEGGTGEVPATGVTTIGLNVGDGASPTRFGEVTYASGSLTTNRGATEMVHGKVSAAVPVVVALKSGAFVGTGQFGVVCKYDMIGMNHDI